MRTAELRHLQAPGEDVARERALELALAAYAERAPSRPKPRRRARLALAGTAAVVALLALTPTGSAVTEWVGDTVRSVVEDDPPARAGDLDELPGGGRVLVVADRQAWIAGDGEPRRVLAGTQEAVWSPHGKFVAAARGAELRAVDPRGDVRWALRAPARIHAVAWSPSGFRVAYAAGAQLRLVAGDGTGDRQVASRRYDPAFTAIAWRPGAEHVLAFADRRTVFVADTDLRQVLWRARAPLGTRLAFSPDGERLLLAGRHELRILSARSGRAVRRVQARPGSTFAGAKWDGTGERLAVVRRTRGRSEVLVAQARSLGEAAAPRPRPLFTAGRLHLIGFSPDDRWLLVDWQETGAWLFLPVNGGRARQVSAVGPRFDARSAAPQGWCCPRSP